MNTAQIIKLLFLSFFLFISSGTFSQTTLKTQNVEAVLYLGKGKSQPLVVGLGGAEGGNAWTSDHWKKTRDQFIERGYAFLAIGYFGAKGTPDTLQEIAIEDVHQAIEEAAKNPGINKKRIAIVGGSRGADLALLLGSYYKDITCVVGIVASNVSFPGNTNHFTTSTWTYQQTALPFVPLNEEAIPFLMKRNLRGAFEAMLKDSIAESKALIKVENISGPVLLISAAEDEVCPSTPMAEKMIARLKSNKFKFHFEHLIINGTHTEPYKHFDLVFAFLKTYFAAK
jgi:dipeptidyl aminopeptidase/acylaminoacyl peptidase